MDYNIFVIKTNYHDVVIASKIPIEKVVEIYEEKGTVEFLKFIRRSARVSFVDIKTYWVGD